MAVKTNSTIEYYEESHLSISTFGYAKGDIEYVMKDYEVTDIYIPLNINELFEQVITDCMLNYKLESFGYYFDDKKIHFSGQKYNESYTPDEKFKKKILSPYQFYSVSKEYV